jgi:hypothetical protein
MDLGHVGRALGSPTQEANASRSGAFQPVGVRQLGRQLAKQAGKAPALREETTENGPRPPEAGRQPHAKIQRPRDALRCTSLSKDGDQKLLVSPRVFPTKFQVVGVHYWQTIGLFFITGSVRI